MNIDHNEYFHFTTKSRLDKSINSLLGIIEGISIDKEINDREIQFLQNWVDEHKDVEKHHPYNELLPVIGDALEDGILSDEEHQDIVWLCNKLTSQEYYDASTIGIQKLHAVLGGIVADGIITEAELKGLSTWLADHEHLRTCYPYDEVDALVLEIMSDGKIDDQEQTFLKQFFSEFTEIYDDKILGKPPVLKKSSITGLCSVSPEITFENSWFCFTGVSRNYKRKDLAEIIINFGGNFTNSVRKDLNYLIIGAEGNPCWAYACYGRKVESAVGLRKKGSTLMIVHENDFLDAVMDFE